MAKAKTGKPEESKSNKVGQNFDLSVMGNLTGGWNVFVKNAKPLILLALLPGLFLVPIDLIISFVLPTENISSFADLTLSQQQAVFALPFLGFGAGVLGIIISAGIVRALLDFMQKGESFTFNDGFSKGLKNVWAYLFVSVLYAVYVVGGLFLLVIPGLFFLVWYAFSFYAALDKGLKPKEALKASKTMIKGRGKPLVLTWLVLAVISGSLGYLPVIGTLSSVVFMPFTTATFTYMYLGYRDQPKKLK